MSLSYQHLFVVSTPSRAAPIDYHHFSASALKSPNLQLPIPSRHVASPLTSRVSLSPRRPLTCRALAPDAAAGSADLDALLSLAEALCVVSSTVVALGYAVNCTFPVARRTILGVVGSHCALAWGVAALAGGVAFGSWLRRRRTPVGIGIGIGYESNMEGFDLVRRVEKLEEDLRSTVSISRVLSRQLEKLGIRFRVTRRTLKDPIAQTAALAQKNSEATRALAAQEDILEQELRGIQRLLLAMQEQQEKQLDLILAISKTGASWDAKREISKEPESARSSDSNQGTNELETQQKSASGASKGANNDKA